MLTLCNQKEINNLIKRDISQNIIKGTPMPEAPFIMGRLSLFTFI
jgi:hypothetical protein